MTISERIFKILSEKNITQKDFAIQVGIANSTVSEWKKKKTNPSSDKLMDICAVLDVTPEQLLTGNGIDGETPAIDDGKHISPRVLRLIEDYQSMKQPQQERLLMYVETLKKLENLEDMNNSMSK